MSKMSHLVDISQLIIEHQKETQSWCDELQRLQDICSDPDTQSPCDINQRIAVAKRRNLHYGSIERRLKNVYHWDWRKM